VSLVDRFIDWATDRCDPTPVVTFDDVGQFTRWSFLRPDEFTDEEWERNRAAFPKRRPYALPWWLPCNVLLHRWEPEPGSKEDFHDHPRWSVTICIKGKIIERTPWGERTLKPGSIVVRSHKAIHSFEVPDGYSGNTWTLFIVGRRKYRQNTYQVTHR
jgi:hypothetical protein